MACAQTRMRAAFQAAVAPLLAGSRMQVLHVGKVDAHGGHEMFANDHQASKASSPTGFLGGDAASGAGAATPADDGGGAAAGGLPCFFSVTPDLRCLRWSMAELTSDPFGVGSPQFCAARTPWRQRHFDGIFEIANIERLHMHDGAHGADAKRLLSRIGARAGGGDGSGSHGGSSSSSSSSSSGSTIAPLLREGKVFELEVCKRVQGQPGRRFVLAVAAESREQREDWVSGLASLKGAQVEAN